MSKITNPIPAQGYEIIRDRIAEILIDEINGQFVETNDDDLQIRLFVERSKGLAIEELPAINVSLSRGEFRNKHANHVDGNYTYYIDCHTAAKYTDSKEGDSLASVKLQRLIGVCRTILEHDIYKTLGFESPFISQVYISELNIAEPVAQDTCSTMMGRLTFNVRANEKITGLTANIISGYETQIKIGTSELGYYYNG